MSARTHMTRTLAFLTLFTGFACSGGGGGGGAAIPQLNAGTNLTATYDLTVRVTGGPGTGQCQPIGTTSTIAIVVVHDAGARTLTFVDDEGGTFSGTASGVRDARWSVSSSGAAGRTDVTLTFSPDGASVTGTYSSAHSASGSDPACTETGTVTGTRRVIGGGPGPVSVVLTWNGDSDVDLGLTPSGGFTYSGDRQCPDTHNESYTNNAATRGPYVANAFVFEICSGSSVQYSVTVNRQGMPPLLTSRTGSGSIIDPSRELAVPFTF